MTTRYIRGMQGMGDEIYQRAVFRELPGPLYLQTSWPQIYADLPHIRPVLPTARFRTQGKNIDSVKGATWHKPPDMKPESLAYTVVSMKKRSILDGIAGKAGVTPRVFDLPSFPMPEVDVQRPYAVIRPVTYRREWLVMSRSPEEKYIRQAAEILKSEGFFTVLVADVDGKKEWAKDLPPCDVMLNAGELGFPELMGLLQGADLVTGGVGFIVPAAIAMHRPLITILGGQGGFNAPEKIVSPPMDDSRAQWIYPDEYCRCTDMRHPCKKLITGFEGKFRECLKKL